MLDLWDKHKESLDDTNHILQDAGSLGATNHILQEDARSYRLFP